MSSRQALPRSVEVTIERLSHEGRGVAHVDGKTLFVADALPGERVEVRITRRHRRFDEGVTEHVLAADPTRVDPRCPHAAACGGCSLQHLAPAAQVAHKESVLLELLRHQANARPVRVLPAITGPVWGYRRRARLSVREVHKKGRVLIGFREKSSHYVAEITRCDVLTPDVGHRLEALHALVESLDIRAQIPQIEIAADDHHTLVLIRHLVPVEAPDRARLRAFEEDTGLRVHLQSGAAQDSTPLGEPVALSYAVDDLRFAFRPGDFVQVNAAINQQLVAHAVALLAPEPHERVLDLFCGLGNFTLPVARRAGHVLGLEGEAGLVARARANAAANGCANALFDTADLASPEGAARAARECWDRVLLDPPRSGAEQVLKALDLAATRRVVYVSCNPVTLARDTAILVRDRGFTLGAAGVIDMFPHTAHVESIAVFDRRR
ncbi:MAG: 23S rRNA (uracil(1939)-C(5))-methyltransferase RlmD [Gammaproteobacteria bacterium]